MKKRTFRRAPDECVPRRLLVRLQYGDCYPPQSMNLRRRPSKLADALTRKAYRDYNKVQAGPRVQWIAKVDTMSALDAAEASGKKQA